MADLHVRAWLAVIGATAMIATGCVASAPRCAAHVTQPARAQQVPADTAPVEVRPVDGLPADRAPVDSTPVEIAIDTAAVVAAVRQAPGVVAAIVFDRSAGRYLIAEEPDRPFQSASLVKLLIAVDRLSRQPVDERTRSRLSSMLATSNDAVASQFWAAGGGNSIIRRLDTALHLSAVPPRPESLWGWTQVSAQDILTVYQYILDGLAPADRELILSALRSAPRIATDGYDQHFGIPDGLPGMPWAIKQGWSEGQGVVAVHSTGLVGAGDRYIVVLMTEHPARVGWRAAMRQATATMRLLAPLFP
jgi:hypothetical protein